MQCHSSFIEGVAEFFGGDPGVLQRVGNVLVVELGVKEGSKAALIKKSDKTNKAECGFLVFFAKLFYLLHIG